MFPDKWAILIGVHEYENVEKLKYCTLDVSEFSEHLQKHLDFKADHIVSFGKDLQFQPRFTTIYHELATFTNSGQFHEEDLLIFYFSGHGIRDKMDYILPIDAAPRSLKKTGIDVESLVGHLKETGCKNIVMFIDACREAISGEKNVGAGIGEQSKDLLEREGIVTFFSCNPDELSFEIDDLNHGSFTHCILEAIREGQCSTVRDLDTYLRKQVPIVNAKHQKRPQRPYTVIQPAEKYDLPLFASAAMKAVATMKWDELKESLGSAYYDPGLEDDCFVQAIDTVEKAQAGTLELKDTKRLILIEKLFEKKLNAKAFNVAWKALDKVNVRSPLSPLKKK